MVQSKNGYAGSDECDDEVFVEWVRFSENGKMKEHDRKELA